VWYFFLFEDREALEELLGGDCSKFPSRIWEFINYAFR